MTSEQQTETSVAPSASVSVNQEKHEDDENAGSQEGGDLDDQDDYLGYFKKYNTAGHRLFQRREHVKTPPDPNYFYSDSSI